VWEVDLVAGVSYVFTLCPTTCPSVRGAWDSLLRLYSPACDVVGEADDGCGVGAELRVTATETGRHLLEVTGSTPADVGDYVFGTFQDCGGGSCATPNGTLTAPSTTCQTLTDALACASSKAWSVVLVQGQTYTFTLCPATCPGAGADFDAALLLRGPAGNVVASSGDACGDDGEITYTTDSLGGGGTYCLELVREALSGSFTLGWRVACQPPSDVSLTPTAATATVESCGRVQAFTVTLAGTPRFDGTWEVVAPPGGSALPASGPLATSRNDASFSATLQGAGDYTVRVTLGNDCGASTDTFTTQLQDRAAPGLAVTATAAACRLMGMPSDPAVPGGAPPGRLEFQQPVAPAPLAAASPVLDGAADAVLRDLARALAARPLPAAVAAEMERRAAEKLARLDAPDVDPGWSGAMRPKAVTCATPCTFGSISAPAAWYDVALSCSDGSFTARTGSRHSVTATAGAPQNVIFGGAALSPGTSDVAWMFHDLDVMLQDPPGGRACVFDPADTPAEPNSVGVEMEWDVEPSPGVLVTLREEIVAFGSTEANSGIRLTLRTTNRAASSRQTLVGMRWQIDYQNAGDDGPLFATVTCDPPEVVATLDQEHELLDSEIADFYRIQNNTGAPIFGNFTNTTALAGFPDTGRPDRLVYGYWPSMVRSAWDRPANEGDGSVDFDSAVHYTFGHDAATAFALRPGESVRRSVVIFTSSESADCNGFTPGDTTAVDLTICEGECARIEAVAQDACSVPAVTLVSTTAGAPPCGGNPCVVPFDAPGTFTYTWEAADEAGNATVAATTVRVLPVAECTACSLQGVAPTDPPRTCAGEAATLDASGLALSGCPGGATYEWRSGAAVVGTGPVVTVAPAITTTYTVTVSCASDPSCRATEQVVVSVDVPPVMTPVSVVDHAPCNLALLVSWSEAAWSGVTGTGVYNVFRSTTSCADALLAPPVALGLTVTSFIDTRTEIGTTYTYVVEAENDGTASPCTPRGAHHGGAADRECAGPASDVSADASVPDGVHIQLFVRRQGDDITAHWAGARPLLPGEHFHLLRAWDRADVGFEHVNGETSTARSYTETDTSGRIQFLDLRVADPCETLSLREFGWGR
jgi:hypothetical protein